jgi:hypothetical protein
MSCTRVGSPGWQQATLVGFIWFISLHQVVLLAQTPSDGSFNDLPLIKFRGVTPGQTTEPELRAHPQWNGPPKEESLGGGLKLLRYESGGISIAVAVFDGKVRTIDLCFPTAVGIEEVMRVFNLEGSQHLTTVQQQRELPPEAFIGEKPSRLLNPVQFSTGRALAYVCEDNGNQLYARRVRFYGPALPQDPVGRLPGVNRPWPVKSVYRGFACRGYRGQNFLHLQSQWGKPQRIEKDDRLMLSYNHYSFEDAKVVVSVVIGVDIHLIDVIPKQPTSLTRAVEQFGLGDPLRCPMLPESMRRGPEIPADCSYYRCGRNVVVMVDEANRGQANVIRIRYFDNFHGMDTNLLDPQELNQQFGVAPSNELAPLSEFEKRLLDPETPLQWLLTHPPGLPD